MAGGGARQLGLTQQPSRFELFDYAAVGAINSSNFNPKKAWRENASGMSTSVKKGVDFVVLHKTKASWAFPAGSNDISTDARSVTLD